VSHGLLQALAILAAGFAAGTINTVVGSGTLVTFPTLLAFGYPPVVANVSNNIGLVPGVLSGVHGYRAELAGQRRRVVRLGVASLLGGLAGAILLLVLPAGAFKEIVPTLIGIALVMVIFQPRLSKFVATRQQARGTAVPGEESDGDESDGGQAPAVEVGGPVLWVLVFLSGVYGGYFGAAQGVLLLGLMGVAFTDNMQRINAVKNVLAALVNGIAALVFVIATHIDWGAAGLIACGGIVGGQVGARIGRKLPPWGLRLVIICVGAVALVKLLA
jgi:uncharacterized membrane protein YfcA